MNITEQNEIKNQYYNEAIRYMENAKDTLIKAEKKNEFYQDKKYVRTACGIAYNAMLIALEAYISLKKPSKLNGSREKTDIKYLQRTLTEIDKKMLNYLNTAYEILHKDGYYDGIQDAVVIKRGFDVAFFIINKIKP